MRISIVVPVYNEEATIGAVLDELLLVPLDKEIIVVDDASADGTGAILDGRATTIVVERLAVNGGKGTAVRRGIELAGGDIVVIQDADLELRPSRIVDLVGPIERGEADAVFGSRFLEAAAAVAWSRRLANGFLTWLTNRIFHLALTDMETAQKAFRRSLLDGVTLTAERFEIEVELTAKLARLGARIIEVPSPYEPRTKDEGKKIRASDGLLAVRTILRLRKWQPEDDRQPMTTTTSPAPTA